LESKTSVVRGDPQNKASSPVMPSVLSADGCVGTVISTMRRKAPEPMDASNNFETLRTERDALAAKLEEAKLRIEALEEKVGVSQKLECEASSETSSVKAERDILAAELKEAQLQIEEFETKQKDLGEELSQEVKKSSKASSETSSVKAERDILAAKLKEAQLQIEAFEKKQKDLGEELSQEAQKSSKAGEELDMLQKELARSKLECKSEVLSMRKTLSGVSAELEGAKAEQAEMRKELLMEREVARVAEVKGAALQAELDALRIEFKECAAVAARCEAAQQQARTLELERGALLQEVEHGTKTRAELEDVRRRMEDLVAEQEDLVAERDTAMAQHGEAVRQVRILQEEQESLQTTVTTKKQKRKDSFKALSRGLSDISAQLDSAQTSWTPKKHIGSTQQKVESLWQDLAGEESEDDLVRGG